MTVSVKRFGVWRDLIKRNISSVHSAVSAPLVYFILICISFVGDSSLPQVVCISSHHCFSCLSGSFELLLVDDSDPSGSGVSGSYSDMCPGGFLLLLDKEYGLDSSPEKLHHCFFDSTNKLSCSKDYL